MATSTSPRAPTNSSSAPRPLPAKLRRQSTFERPPPAPTAVPQPLTPTLLSRSASRSRSTPPQHTLLPSSSSLGESIFQSLSFGFTSSKADPSSRRAPPTRSSTMLANVLESPIQLEPQPDPMMDTHQSTYTYGTSRRRVTSPDTTLPGLARAASPHANSNDAHLRLGNSSPRSPPLPFGDAHPRKAKSALRLSRLRPGSIRDDATLSSAADPVPGTPPAAVMVGERPLSTRVASRRPGSAGSVTPRSLIRRAEKDTSWTDDERQSAATGGRTRGMRVRASSEFTRPVLHMSSVLRESDEVPPSPRHAECRPQYAELRPALLGSSGSRLSPVPVSPGVQSTWSKKSDQSALADDSDIDADVPTTPSATRNDRLGSTSGSSVKQDEPATATPTGTFSVPLSDPASRTQAREDADRRRRQEILREREERARQAGYFVLKGPAKDRCHAFSASEAPYPLSYSPRVLNHQILDNELSRYMRSAMTYHDFKEHPAKVLDLGCGTGHWILSAAQEWPKTHFVGFDLVPIQPSLERVTSRAGATIGGSKHLDLALNERIRWVHGNFLEGLPFEDGEFDFVRCRKIARGVPEAKWDGLYEEIVRVMKPGGAFEHIEEDIVFPAEISAKPTHSPLATFPTPSPSRGPPAPPYLSSSLPAGARSSVIRPPDQYRRSPSTSFSSAIESPVEGRNGLPSAASTTSSASLVPTSTVATSFQPPSSVPSSGSGTNLAVPVPTAPSFSESVSSIPNKDSRGSGDSVERAPRLPQAQDFSFYDPRVHAKLEDLFSSMHEARWINLKPLSLIPRLIQEHFVKMASAPPLNINLPPRPRDNWIQPRMVDVKAVIRVSGDALTQFIKARVEQALEQPNPNPALEGFKNLDPQPGDEEVGRYMSFDFLRMGNVSKSQGLPLFPAAHFQFDLSHLPMVLSSAASDVIACKEAMWEHLKEQEPGFDRREYDAMMRQYQTDMQDRIGMSTTLRQRLGWGPPESDFMRTADQRAFEENYVRAVTLDQADPSGSQRQPRLMRRLRAFIAWKAAE